MSKQSEAKERQEYDAKPNPAVCMNCGNFKFDMVPTGWPASYPQEKEGNYRCGIGQFAVKKMATCRLFQWKKKPVDTEERD